MMIRKVVFDGGVVLVVFATLMASATATSSVYFAPDPSSADPGDTATVTLWLDTDDGVAAFSDDIHFDTAIVNITGATAGDFPQMWTVVHYGTFIRIGGWSADFLDHTGHLKLADLTLKAQNPGRCTVYHTENEVGHFDGTPVSATWTNGTFTCIAPPETFSKPLAAGWNLISLPLTNATDMTVANIMSSVSYDALYRYDAVSKSWVSLSPSDAMSNGVGYFIHLTAADTWTYTGSAYTAMNVALQPGLNMPGWLNCTKSTTDGLSSIAGSYNYVARWNATSQEFETYNPAAPSVFNDFTTMERGEGYFISAKAAGTLNEAC